VGAIVAKNRAAREALRAVLATHRGVVRPMVGVIVAKNRVVHEAPRTALATQEYRDVV
jgi:hypothetical protein